MISFFVPGVPVPKGSAKAFYRPGMRFPVVVQTNHDKQKPWASAIHYHAKEVMKEKGGGPCAVAGVMLTLTFNMPRPKSHYNSKGVVKQGDIWHLKKPDLDKLIRCVKDALIGVVYNDDSQVFQIVAQKIYAPIQPGVQIAVQFQLDGDYSLPPAPRNAGGLPQ